jgi:uncharacterized integral membrane protein (TIGR00698 family)
MLPRLSPARGPRLASPPPVAHPEPSAWEKALLGVRWVQFPLLLPGLLAALGVTLVAQQLAALLGTQLLRMQGLASPGRSSPVSAIALAVILGLLLSRFAQARVLAPGLDFAVKKLLRLGIILLGLKLAIGDVLKVGAVGIPLVATVVAVGIAASLLLSRLLRVSRALGLLAAASTGICGITAALAVAPVLEADEKEVAYTVANVTLFGLAGMLLYPFLAHHLFAANAGAAGAFLGTAIHDTSQVIGAALSYEQMFSQAQVAQIATVTKLTRNSLLVVVVPLLALLHRRMAAKERGAPVSLRGLFPLFVLGFLAAALLRSGGEATLASTGYAYGLWAAHAWGQMIRLLGEQTPGVLLGLALASVGLSTRLSVLRVLGWAPLLLGLVAALSVSLSALGLSALVGPLLGTAR